MNKKWSYYIGFINTYVRISFKFISLCWTYKHRYVGFINNESKQENVYTTIKYINSFLSQTTL